MNAETLLGCDFLADETSDLPQTTQLVETAAGDLGNVCLHRKLSVELDAKIANRLHWLNDVGADCQVQRTFWNFTKDLLRTKPDEFCFSFVKL